MLLSSVAGHALAQGAASAGADQPLSQAVAPDADADPATRDVAANSGKVVYDRAFFDQYNVQNADDVLRRIPGVSAILNALGSNTQARGFGSGGDQILVDGRRFPGKSNEIGKTLARLRAASILRVELIRGASDDIDVQSTGIVVNIVLKPGASLGGGGNYDLNVKGNDRGRVGVDGLGSYAGSWGRLGYSFGIEQALWSPPQMGQVRWSDRSRDEVFRYPNGALQELRPQDWDRRHDKTVGNVGLTYDLPSGTRLQLNGLYETRHGTEIDTTPLVRYDQTGRETLRATERHVRDVNRARTVEIGGELRAALGRGELTAILIANRIKTPTLDFRSRQEPARLVEMSRSFSEANQSEDIGRLSYSMPFGRGMTLEIGGEGARTTLRQQMQSFFDTNGDGVLEELVVPIGDARVKELRGEGFINHKWTLNSRLSLNSSLNVEYSKLTTNSAFNRGRTLTYPKPRLDARYKMSKAGQLRLLIERTVSQLDFLNFVPSYNVLDDRIDAGNPGLLPERIWTLELGYEHRLAADAGVIEGRLFYNDITDPIDRYPLRQGGVFVSAQGNLAHARRYGVEGKASVRLVPIGLRDAVVTLRAMVQNSRAIDPFTGQPRPIRSDADYNLDVGFRHDVRALALAYGFDYKNVGSNRIQSDLFSLDLFRIAPMLEAFAERRLTRALLLRLEAQNLLGGDEYRSRTQFLVNQMDGRVRRLDNFHEKRDLRYAVRLRGTF